MQLSKSSCESGFCASHAEKNISHAGGISNTASSVTVLASSLLEDIAVNPKRNTIPKIIDLKIFIVKNVFGRIYTSGRLNHKYIQSVFQSSIGTFSQKK